MADRKRSRSVNWEEKEKRLLIDCVAKHIHVIESMETDTNLHFKKKAAWAEIQAIFESQGYGREATRLREQWFRMKAHAKKSISLYWKDPPKNGDPSGSVQPGAMDWAIVELVHPELDELDPDANVKKRAKLAQTIGHNDDFNNDDMNSRNHSNSPDFGNEHDSTPLKVILTEGRHPLEYYGSKRDDMSENKFEKDHNGEISEISTKTRSDNLTERLIKSHIDKVETRKVLDEELQNIQKCRDDEDYQFKKLRDTEEYELKKQRDTELYNLKFKQQKEEHVKKLQRDTEQHAFVMDTMKEIRAKYVQLIDQMIENEKNKNK